MLTKYGLDNIIIMLIIAVILIILSFFTSKIYIAMPLLSLGVLLALFTFCFFRDPERTVPEEAKISKNIIISPADGKVVEVKEIYEKNYLKADAVQISIFLSPLDVHVNRIPISGVIKYFRYNPGNYLVAWHPKSSELNEQSHIGMETGFGKIFFKQITGILARRLVWDIKEGDTVEIGQRFGMMKFGSRMDLMISKNSEVFVKVGDKVIGGTSFIAKLK